MAERLGNFTLEAAVKDVVRRLRAAGYVTGILTNGHVRAACVCVCVCVSRHLRCGPTRAPRARLAAARSRPATVA